VGIVPAGAEDLKAATVVREESKENPAAINGLDTIYRTLPMCLTSDGSTISKRPSKAAR